MDAFSRKTLLTPFLLLSLLCLFTVVLFYPSPTLATHAATTNGEIEARPSPVLRRVCLAGTNVGAYCNENSDCPSSSCFSRNVYNITVAILYDAPAADLTTIQTVITALSTTLFDATDGQAELGTVTIHNNAISSAQADFVIHPSTNDTGWQANSGHYRTGGFMEVSINRITNPAGQGGVATHEFSHLVFDVRDEYETRANCGAVVGASGSASCPVAAAGDGTCVMDGNGSEYCWGQGSTVDLTDLSAGNHDPANVTEQSACRNNRSCWDQVSWSWPATILEPTGAPDPAANGGTVNPPNFIITSDQIRVVLVLDESGSMDKESPTRISRLKVAAKDFIATAESGAQLGVVSYSDNASTASGHAGVAISALGANRSTWNTAVDDLGTDGWTNIGDGLQKAKDMIVAAGGVTANTYIVLMTDGVNNRPEPQANADADLTAKITDLLSAGIPVYVTCTGGDLGLQSQCSEIAAGTGGFYSDAANPATLAENFVDFQQRISGHQSIESDTGKLAKNDQPYSYTFFVDKGSESVNFSLLWQDPAGGANMHMTDPDGNQFRASAIPQGKYVHVANPIPGTWEMTMDHASGSGLPFVARAYTRNRINGFVATLRKASYLPSEEIYVYTIARSLGGTITQPGTALTAQVTRPDGSTDTVTLRDEGRDAGGHGDDVAGDGIFTGVYTNTAAKGAYGFHFKVNVDQWQQGEEDHLRDANRLSPKFKREVRLSAGVSDPTDIVVVPEDTPEKPDKPTGADHKLNQIYWLLIAVLLISLIAVWMIWRCCQRGKLSTNANHRIG